MLGGAGFLGRHVTRRALAASGAGDGSVSIASRDPRAALRGSSLPRTVVAHALDGTRADDLERLLDETNPARLVNCIALASLGRCAAEPALAQALNAELPARLARWTASRGARLVHVSTDLVFGGDPPRPSGYREDDAAEPSSEYGRSKLRGEEAVLDADPRAAVVRLPLLYGDSHGTGQGASDSLLFALESGAAATLFSDEWRSPLDVEDAASALLELSGLPEVHGRLHVAGPDSLTRYDLGLLILAARGLSATQAARLVRRSTRAEAGSAAERPRDVCLDARKARGLLATRLHAVVETLSARPSA